MAERIVGLFKGVELHRNVLYCALWTQLEGIEQKQVYRISITRSNHGNIYSWNGSETIRSGSRVEGFATGRPESITIGKARFDSTELDWWTNKLNRPTVLMPHEFVVTLLQKLETFESYHRAIPIDWSITVQEWWDTQELVISTPTSSERYSRPYSTQVKEKYDSLHQRLDGCPITDGVVRMSEQRERYDPRSPPGNDPVKDGLSRAGSKQSSPSNSRRSSPTSSRQSSPMPSPTRAFTFGAPPANLRLVLPTRTNTAPQLQTWHEDKSPVYPYRRTSMQAQMQPPRQQLNRSSTYQSGSAPDPKMRPSEARRNSRSMSLVDESDRYREITSTGLKPPRSKQDQQRSDRSFSRRQEHVQVAKAVIKILAATAVAVV